MSAISTPPAIAYSSIDHQPPGNAFLTPLGVLVQAAAIAVPPGIYTLSATATVTGGAVESRIIVAIQDLTTLGLLMLVTDDVPAGFLAVISLTPRRIVIPNSTVLGLMGQNNTITTSLIALAGPGCYITAQLCT